jgi:putative transcriptional regulator
MDMLQKLLDVRSPGFLTGQMLIAMPGMIDTRFARSLIYVCAHSAGGTMGLVVNQAAVHLQLSDLLVQLHLIEPQEILLLPQRAKALRIMRGGPMDSGRGFVLHTPDYSVRGSTVPLQDGISLTASVDILKAIAEGHGPERAMLALGYAGWTGGQIEEELKDNAWLTCPAAPSLIFGVSGEDSYERALGSMGIDLVMLSTEAGHG